MLNECNYLMRKPNQSQGYRILDGRNVHTCNDPRVIFEWALIDRGPGKTPVVAHWVSADDQGWYRFENIEWSYGHYFETLLEAEVYLREKLVWELATEIQELKEILKEERELLQEVREELPEEEE